jgi:hypothetical protein
MLNPARRIPDQWPEALRVAESLAGFLDGDGLAAIGAWAAFTYQGR